MERMWFWRSPRGQSPGDGLVGPQQVGGGHRFPLALFLLPTVSGTAHLGRLSRRAPPPPPPPLTQCLP